MDISNPFLRLQEFRTTGTSRYPHGGAIFTLGAGAGTAMGFVSPMEVNFEETELGRSTRGRIPLRQFYTVRQVVLYERLWHWRGESAAQGSWHQIMETGRQADDPVIAPHFPDRPAGVSFLDSPGIMFSSVSAAGRQGAHRICLLQNFDLWVEVSGRYATGRFQAASNVIWFNLLCLERVDAILWRVRQNQSLLGRGEMRMARPMWT
jgi:hypothetical protein